MHSLPKGIRYRADYSFLDNWSQHFSSVETGRGQGKHSCALPLTWTFLYLSPPGAVGFHGAGGLSFRHGGVGEGETSAPSPPSNLSGMPGSLGKPLSKMDKADSVISSVCPKVCGESGQVQAPPLRDGDEAAASTNISLVYANSFSGMFVLCEQGIPPQPAWGCAVIKTPPQPLILPPASLGYAQDNRVLPSHSLKADWISRGRQLAAP